MKTPILFFAFIFVSFLIKAQQDSIITTSISKEKIDTIKPFQACNKDQVYAIDFYLLTEKLGKELKQPKEIPVFISGTPKLREYFENHPLQDPRAKKMVLRVNVAFLVNCEGKIGDFILLNDFVDMEAEVVKEVMDITTKMPQKWTIAKDRKKNNVDCYQVVSLTIFNGVFTSVYYKKD